MMKMISLICFVAARGNDSMVRASEAILVTKAALNAKRGELALLE